MSQYSPQTSFDLTFDSTFHGVLLSPVNPVVDGCRAPGAYLTWHSPTGWPHWLFEGPIITSKLVTARGSAQQGGSLRYSQKESFLQLTIRTAGLTPEQIEAVATIYESEDVYLLVPDAADAFHAVPVSIDPGQFELHNSRFLVSDLSVTINLPARRSALL